MSFKRKMVVSALVCALIAIGFSMLAMMAKMKITSSINSPWSQSREMYQITGKMILEADAKTKKDENQLVSMRLMSQDFANKKYFPGEAEQIQNDFAPLKEAFEKNKTLINDEQNKRITEKLNELEKLNIQYNNVINKYGGAEKVMKNTSFGIEGSAFKKGVTLFR